MENWRSREKFTKIGLFLLADDLNDDPNKLFNDVNHLKIILNMKLLTLFFVVLTGFLVTSSTEITTEDSFSGLVSRLFRSAMEKQQNQQNHIVNGSSFVT